MAEILDRAAETVDKVRGFVGTRPVRAGAAAVASLVLYAGCGKTINAGSETIKPCGSEYYNSFDGPPISSTAEVIREARKNAKTLRTRANNNGGKIDLDGGAAGDDTVDVIASKDKLILRFDPKGYAPAEGTDEVEIGFNNGEPKLAKGAVICSEEGQLYQNGTAYYLRVYVDQTAALDH